MIKIHSLHFKTKKDAKLFFQKWLRERIGKTFTQSSEEYNILLSLLMRHPWAQDKIRSGVNYFKIIKNQRTPGHHAETWVYDTNGRGVDFSWLKCIANKDWTDKALLIKAMRESINYQIFDFKKTNDQTQCAICQKELGGEVTHIDHVKPFKDLAARFLEIWKGPIPNDFSETNSFKPEDFGFAGTWQAYHKREAILQYACATCNLSKK